MVVGNWDLREVCVYIVECLVGLKWVGYVGIDCMVNGLECGGGVCVFEFVEFFVFGVLVVVR